MALPPGAGKTLVGLEVVRRLGNPAVVFVPNTAIQSQWCIESDAYQPDSAGTDRQLSSPVTVLTYQSLATFDTDEASADRDADGDTAGIVGGSGAADGDGLVDRLHPNGQALLEQLRHAGPLTIVLDECHHLLEVWGRLLAEVLELIPDTVVLGLTATPPETLGASQAELVEELFGDIVFQASIPAAVREAELAPFAELAWLTTPTADESGWLSAQAERFRRLTVELMDPQFASVDLLGWLDRRFTDPHTPWRLIKRDDPALAAAVLRLSHAGMLALPAGARVREEHRHRPDADDWVEVIDDWVRHGLRASTQQRDIDAVDAIARTLPSVGYRLTRHGIRRGRSPVDRVLARSAAKADACVEVVAAEHAALGERARVLVVCDFESASARAPESVRAVLDDEAGSARLMLQRLVADPRTATLSPVLVTGRTVAADAPTARRLVEFVTDAEPHHELSIEPSSHDGVVRVAGSWSSRSWVRLVTEFFQAGQARVLIGTRALLGEGWDAPRLSSLVDLTAATTASAVVQTRGRALRTDPGWPDKVAITWSVVCVAEQHPRGGTDWDRFVRKHSGYFGVDDSGEVVSGVSHVDGTFSPYAPPSATTFDALNATMLLRAERRDDVRRTWRIGEDYHDRVVHTVRVRPRRRTATAATAPEVRGAEPPTLVISERGPRRARSQVRAGRLAWWRPWRSVRAVAGAPGLERFAAAVADGLAAVGLSEMGAAGVQIRVEADGTHRFVLGDVDEPTSLLFATALDEAVSAPSDPRYLVPRYVLHADAVVAAGWRLLVRTLRPDATAWHAVPGCLGVNARRATAYAHAWNAWVSAGEVVYTRNPDGAGLLAAHRGFDPLEVDTLLRPGWR